MTTLRHAMILGLVFLLFVPVVVEAELSNQEWSRARSQFRAGYANRDAAQRLEAVRALGQVGDLRAMDLLLSVLKRSGEDASVRKAAREALARFTGEATVERLASQMKRARGQFAVDLAGLLAKRPGPVSVAALLQALRSSDSMVKTAAIDALGTLQAKEAVPAVAKELNHSAWQVRVAAVHALATLRTEECVDALIDRLEKEKAKGGRLPQDIEEALYALTGKRMGDNAELWRSWWTVKRKEGLKGPGVEGLKPKKADPFARLRKLMGQPGGGGNEAAANGDGGSEVPTYYGLKILSKRLVFIIDMSGSMSGPIERKAEPQPALTGGAPGEKAPDMSQIKTKLDLAKYELIKAIRGLKKGQHFNVIFYHHDVTAWKKGLVPASKGNKAEIIKKVKALQPDGLTNIYGALEQGFFIWQKVLNPLLDAGNGMVIQNGQLIQAPTQKESKKDQKELDENETVVRQEYKRGIDSMYFMTDGSPTAGKDQTDDGILAAVEKWNKVRKVKIHTIGIGPHNESLMRELAARNQGKYVTP